MNRMIKIGRKVKVAGISVLAFLAGASVALAQTQGPQSISFSDPLGGHETFPSVATAVAGFLFWDIALPLCTIMVLVGAFQMMTSAGDPEKFSKGRKTILYAAIGFAIALIAGGVANLIKNVVSGGTG